MITKFNKLLQTYIGHTLKHIPEVFHITQCQSTLPDNAKYYVNVAPLEGTECCARIP
jgi:hypothetical protein